jgi:cytosine/adenosine deaminase-related metal-dependent hydrolase
MEENGVMLVSNPTAYIDDKRNENLVPSHNSVSPVDELGPAGVTVAIGTDNIHGLHKPFTDGDMWAELRLLLESCRLYDVDELVKIATINGRKVLGLED